MQMADIDLASNANATRVVGHLVAGAGYTIGYVYGQAMVHEAFAASLAKSTANYPPHTILSHSSARPYHARNKLVEAWLELEDTDWLLFIDTDMVWHKSALRYLFDLAKEKGPGVYGGLCFMWDATVGMPKPTIYFSPSEGHYKNPIMYPKDQAFQVDATGAAFVMYHRNVAQDILKAHPSLYEDIRYGDTIQGNDLTMCARAVEAGYEVWLDSRAKIGHVKTMEVGEESMEQWKRAAHV